MRSSRPSTDSNNSTKAEGLLQRGSLFICPEGDIGSVKNVGVDDTPRISESLSFGSDFRLRASHRRNIAKTYQILRD